MSRAAAALLAALVVFSGALEAAAQRGSVSLGRVDDGSLIRGARLAFEGPGWSVLPENRGRGRNFAVAQLVRTLRRVSRRVSRRHRGSVLQIGDLSQQGGGPMSLHASHQSGRDVDIAFFTAGGSGGRQVRRFLSFDRNLRSHADSGPVRFDVARNWTLVESLLGDGGVEVQLIFVAAHLRRALLDYARDERRAPRIRERARRVLRSTGTAVEHDDHFHVRIYCPPDDLPSCVDTGPVWSWVSARADSTDRETSTP